VNISSEAHVEDIFNIRDTASIEDHARIMDKAIVRGNARVRGRVRVSENAVVKNDALVGGDARIELFAVIGGNAVVTGKALITGMAHVGGSATVDGNAQVDGNALILNKQGIIYGRVGHYDWTAFYDSRQGFVLRFGCTRLPLAKWSRNLGKLVRRYEAARAAYYTKVIRSIIVLARASLRKPTRNEIARSRA
jgi:acyl-[acyl carrier protein]--UDP-N-acetylglucosamine O-acyltransferase